jgi:radical SAM superfamily enzyme YgiQ (UPF0313 family)
MHASLGVLYLAASLREAGHDVKIQDCHKFTKWDGTNLQVDIDALESCDILGVSIVTPNAEFGGQLASVWPAKVRIAGGPHVTYMIEGPHERFKQKKYFAGFDYLMTGECEESFVAFCNAFDAGTGFKLVPGLVYFNEFGMQRNPSPPLPDVTKLPTPAYDLWEHYSAGGMNIKSVHGKSVDAGERTIGGLWSGRGCPFGCSFCSDARTKLREETLEQVEAEVKALSAVGVTAVRFWDDVLTIKDKRCRQLADITHNYGMLFRGCSRVNLTNPDLFHYLGKRGCTEMAFGVEHGSAKMLKAMNKGTTPDANATGVHMCQDAGVAARAYMMIGFPGETQETIYEMIEWLDKVKPDAVNLHIFQPFPGTEVWNNPTKFGVELPDNAFSRMWEQNHDDPTTLVLTLPTISKQELFDARVMLHKWITENIASTRDVDLSRSESTDMAMGSMV